MAAQICWSMLSADDFAQLTVTLCAFCLLEHLSEQLMMMPPLLAAPPSSWLSTHTGTLHRLQGRQDD